MDIKFYRASKALFRHLGGFAMSNPSPVTRENPRAAAKPQRPLAEELGLPPQPPVWRDDETRDHWPPPTPRRRVRGGPSPGLTLMLLGLTAVVSVAAGVTTGRRLAEETVAYFPGGPVSAVMETFGLKEKKPTGLTGHEKGAAADEETYQPQETPRRTAKKGFLASIATPRFGKDGDEETSRETTTEPETKAAAPEQETPAPRQTAPPVQPAQSAASPNRTMTVDTDNLNVRQGPGVNHPSLAKLVVGTRVSVMKQVKGDLADRPCWFQVSLDGGKTGYVACEFLK